MTTSDKTYRVEYLDKYDGWQLVWAGSDLEIAEKRYESANYEGEVRLIEMLSLKHADHTEEK